MGDMNVILNEVSDLHSRSLKIKGGYDQLLLRKSDLEKKVSLDKRFVEIHPEVTEILDGLQSAAHQRSVGAYERMLTAIVDDVLGDNGKKVSFEMKISRGVPSLFVSIDNNGNTEDIMDGQGGSVANVVSTGLRYIALSRLSDNRRFVLLDEPDCWLSTDKIPAYFNVLNKLSKEVGIQSVVISHHDRESFGSASVVKVSLDEDDGTIEAENLTDIEWKDDEKGIRKIRLFNYMSHEFTEFELSKGVTVISGENNIGKSAIVSAIRAVSYNEGKDHMIKHGEEDCCVEVFIENDLIVRWTRKRKGKDKTKYELLTVGGDLLHEEYNGNTVPDWCEKALGIKKVNDIDVHISHQKIPMFMISESPAKRAEILSMGKESQYLQKMIGLHKDDLRQSRLSVKDGERDLTSILNVTEVLSGIDSIIECGDDFLNKAQEAVKFEEKDRLLEVVIKKQTLLNSIIDISESVEKSAKSPSVPLINNECSLLEDVISKQFLLNNSISHYSKVEKINGTPSVPSIDDKCTLLENSINKIVKCEALSKINNDSTSPKVPDIYDCVSLIDYGIKIKKTLNKIGFLEKSDNLPDLKTPEVSDNKAIERVIEKMEEVISFGKGLSASRTKVIKGVDAIEEAINKLVEEAGGMCPLCGNEMDEEHLFESSLDKGTHSDVKLKLAKGP